MICGEGESAGGVEVGSVSRGTGRVELLLRLWWRVRDPEREFESRPGVPGTERLERYERDCGWGSSVNGGSGVSMGNRGVRGAREVWLRVG